MFALGGGAIPIVGTAEQVTLQLKYLYDNGADAVLVIFLSFLYYDIVWCLK
jgi:hypothetical protein